MVPTDSDFSSDDDYASMDGSNSSKAQRDRKMACVLTVPETFIAADSRNKQFYYPQMVSIGPFHYYQYNYSVLEGNATVAVARKTTTGAGASASASPSEDVKGAVNNNNRQKEQVLKIAELLAIGDMERKGRLVHMEKDKHEAYIRFWNDDKDGSKRFKKVLSEDKMRKKIADHYDRNVLSRLNDTKFDRLIRHDAVFLLEFMEEYVEAIQSQHATREGSSQQQRNVVCETVPDSKDNKDKREPLFSKRNNNLVLYAILMDIMKLENQIPMMVLEKVTEEKKLKPKLQTLLEKLSLHVSPIREIEKAPELQNSKHLLDSFLKTICMDVNVKNEKPPLNVRIRIYKLLQLLAQMLQWLAKMFCKCRLGLKAAEQTAGGAEDHVEHRYLIGGAYKIKRAGVQFVVMKGGIKEIEFDSRRCVLWLPRVDVGIWTETLLRNLVAYEACQFDNGNETEEKLGNGTEKKPVNGTEEKLVTRFVLFMSQLLDSQRSAEVLKECGVLIDNLGDSERVVHMWNSMSMSRWIPECKVFDTATTKLNRHLASTLVGYFFEFWERYLSRPWLLLAVIVCAITFIASILGVWNPFHKEKK